MSCLHGGAGEIAVIGRLVIQPIVRLESITMQLAQEASRGSCEGLLRRSTIDLTSPLARTCSTV